MSKRSLKLVAKQFAYAFLSALSVLVGGESKKTVGDYTNYNMRTCAYKIACA